MCWMCISVPSQHDEKQHSSTVHYGTVLGKVTYKLEFRNWVKILCVCQHSLSSFSWLWAHSNIDTTHIEKSWPHCRWGSTPGSVRLYSIDRNKPFIKSERLREMFTVTPWEKVWGKPGGLKHKRKTHSVSDKEHTGGSLWIKKRTLSMSVGKLLQRKPEGSALMNKTILMQLWCYRKTVGCHCNHINTKECT